jgi:hypothetical protein
MNSHPNWQESLNPKLMQRLVRPLVQPGVISSKMAESIVLRSQRFANRLPMLAIAYRGYATSNSKVEPVPIVYAQPQPVLTNAVSTNLESHSQPLLASGESRNTQSGESRSSTQPVIVQAKFASPSSQATLPTNLPINTSERLTGLTDTQPPKTENLPSIALGSPAPNLPSELLPIVPAQTPIYNTNSQAGMASNLSQVDTSRTDANKPTIVQAKFAAPNTSSSIASSWVSSPQNPVNISQSNASPTSESISLPLRSVKEEKASQDLAGFPNINPIDSQNFLPTISVIKADDRHSASPSNSTASLDRIQANSIQEKQIPIVYLHSRQAEGVTPPLNYSTTNAIAATPSSTDRAISRSQPLPKVFAVPGKLNPSPELQEPLVFTQPPATPQSAAKPAAQTDKSNHISNPALVESSNSQVSNSQVSNSIQPETNSNQPVNIDALADKIERKLMRKLIVENERRGGKSWS